MNPDLKSGHELFVSRMQDALRQLDRGKPWVLTAFLSPVEQELAGMVLKKQADLYFWGGHEKAERKQLCISLDGKQLSDLVCLHDPVQCSHSQVLGKLIHAGYDRKEIGDILTTDQGLFLFCRARMAGSIANDLPSINGTPVSLKEYAGPVPEIPDKEEITISVASNRLDAVVAALAGCSRAQALEKLRMGHVKRNDIVVDSNVPLCNNDFVSVRHTGRFQFVCVENTTRKGKLRLKFRKY